MQVKLIATCPVFPLVFISSQVFNRNIFFPFSYLFLLVFLTQFFFFLTFYLFLSLCSCSSFYFNYFFSFHSSHLSFPLSSNILLFSLIFYSLPFLFVPVQVSIPIFFSILVNFTFPSLSSIVFPFFLHPFDFSVP